MELLDTKSKTHAEHVAWLRKELANEETYSAWALERATTLTHIDDVRYWLGRYADSQHDIGLAKGQLLQLGELFPNTLSDEIYIG